MVEKIHILCTIDHKFLNLSYVTMYSVIVNNKNREIIFHLMVSENISESECNSLEAYIRSTGNVIHFYKVEKKVFDSRFPICQKYSSTIHYRSIAHFYLPEDLERILYLDTDIIVNGSLDEFYDMDFEDKYMIVTSHTVDPSFCNKLNVDNFDEEKAARGRYFNSGVLLINLKKMREITLKDYQTALEECSKKGLHISYNQGIMNYVLCYRVKYLSPLDYNYRYCVDELDSHSQRENRPYKKLIIHYTGMWLNYRPWDLRLSKSDLEYFGETPYAEGFFHVCKKLNDLHEIWWRYAEQTPVFSQINEEMLIKREWFLDTLRTFMKNHNTLLYDIKKST